MWKERWYLSLEIYILLGSIYIFLQLRFFVHFNILFTFFYFFMQIMSKYDIYCQNKSKGGILMYKKLKVIAILVVIVMTFNFFTPIIYGVNVLKQRTTVNTNELINRQSEDNNSEQLGEPYREPIRSKEYDTPLIVGEDIEKRTLDTKYFVLSNGDTIAAKYSSNIHYEKDGKLENINNSLINGIDDEKDSVLENKSNNFKVKFAKKINKNKLLTLQMKNIKIKWSLENANKVSAKTTNENIQLQRPQNIEEFNSSIMSIENLSNSVMYENILNGIDLKYDIQSDTLKESIILNNKEAINNEITFNLDTGKLIAEVIDTKQIIIYDGTKENIVYVIDPMFMYDANQEYTDEVEVKLEKAKKGYTLKIIPNKEWLTDVNRKYPVIIDPTVTTSVDRADMWHTYIFNGDDNGYPTRHEAHVLRIGSNNRLHYPTRSLIKFTLPTLNAGDQVIAANLSICSYKDYYTPNPTREMQIDVHKVTSDWVNSTAYWKNLKDSYDSKIVDYSLFTFDTENWLTFIDFDITSIVKDWYTTGNNYGVMLKEHSEVYNLADSDAYFLSSDTSSAYVDGRPIITITYRNQTGLENYLSYHTQDAGRAGVIYTNDYNGNLTLIHSDLSTPGTRLPISIYHVYNTNDRNVNIGYGNGFRLNLSQTLSMQTIADKEYIKYIDEDGTSHYFLKNTNTNVYEDEDGLGLKLNLSGTTFTMKDKAGNKNIFIKHADGNNLWHLSEIHDTYGNKITLTLSYDSSRNFIITQVTDGVGDKLYLTYENNKLKTMKDTNNRVLTYTYGSNNTLTQITYPDSKNVYYSYSNTLQLTSAKNIDNSHIDYEYYNASPYRVKKIKEYSTSNELGNTLDVTYYSNLTTFKDNRGYISNISFNNMGQAISLLDQGKSNEFATSYATTYKYGFEGGSKNKLIVDGFLKKAVNNLIVNGNVEWEDEKWTPKELSNNSGTKSRTSEQAYYGSNSLKIATSTSNNILSVYEQPVTIAKGKTYTFSSYIKNTTMNGNDNTGSFIMVSYKDGSGNIVYEKSKKINTVCDWQKNAITFNYPANSQGDFKVYVGIENAKGTAYFDAMQLEEGEIANTFNLVENPNFAYNDRMYGWNTLNSASSDTVITNGEYSNTFYITGDVSKRKYVEQDIWIKGNKDDVLNISALVKTKGIQRDKYANRIGVALKDGNGHEEWYDIPIDPSGGDWQYISDNIIATHNFTKLELYFCFYNNVNDVYVTNFGVYKDEFGQSYTYDKNGNVITVKDKNTEQSYFNYSGNNNLLSNITPKGGKYLYEYDFNNKNKLLNAVNAVGNKYSFDYDNYGNTTSIKVEEHKNTDTVENNETYFINFLSSKRYFDVAGGGTTNGCDVLQWDLYAGNNQRFTFTEVENDYYKISPNHTSGMVLDLDVDSKNVQQWQWMNTDNQKWKLIPNDDGTYRIVSKSQNGEYCLTLEDNKIDNGATILAEKWEGKSTQKVILTKDDNMYNILNQDFFESNEVYYMKSKSSGLYVTVENDIDETAISQKEFDENNKNQLWRIVRDENNKYKIISLASLYGKAIDVRLGMNINNQVLQLYTHSASNKAQEWNLERQDDDSYIIVSNLDGNKRAINAQSTSSGSTLCIYDINYSDNQKFYLEKANIMDVEDGATYKIKAKCSNLYLGINNNNIEQQSTSDSATQQWVIEDLKNGYFKIKSKSGNNMVMDVSGGTAYNGANMQIYEDNGSIAQQFEIIPYDNNIYKIKPKGTSGLHSLDIDTGSITPGGNLQIWESNATDAQKFYLEKISSPSTNKYIQTKAEYSTNGKYLTKVFDQRDKEISYTYNQNTGTVSSMKDSKQAVTNYTYDNLDRTTKVSKVASNKTYENNYTYENDRLKTISHNTANYTFNYNNFGNVSQVKVGNQNLITNNYDANNGNLNNIVYGNNQTVNYQYDRFNRVIKETRSNGNIQYLYNARGNLGVVKNSITGLTSVFDYDLAERPIRVTRNNGQKIEYEYDKNSNISNIKYTLNTTENNTSYSYDRDNRINNVKIGDTAIVITNYDKLSRTDNKELKTSNKSYKTSYTYLDTETANKTTTLVKSMQNGTNQALNYTYDANGNIETISEGQTLKVKYYYDELNQLIRENNAYLNKTITYEYDAGGNILNKKEYAYTENTLGTATSTINYNYTNTNWKDQLTSYNGKTITYDALGNPLTYDGNTYTWLNGRELATLTNTTKGLNINYKYNEEGIRTQKTVNGTVTDYYLDGNQVIYEKTGNNVIYYSYDENGELIGLKYNNTQYYYVKNLQGDIIGILDSDLNEVVKYTYDSWGKIISVKNASGQEITDQNNIAHINPYKYRGYRYDKETGLYYLQSRYYNPEWDRFLNIDSQLNNNLVGNNLYAYCNNNPVNLADYSGCSPLLLLGIPKAFLAVLGIGLGLYLVTGVGIALYDTIVNFSSSTSKSTSINATNSKKGTIVTTNSGNVGQNKNNDSGFDERITQKTSKSTKTQKNSINNDVLNTERTGSALKSDAYHAFPNIVDNYVGFAEKIKLSRGTLYQLKGSLNGIEGRFEWIIQNGKTTHRMFVKGGGINKIPILP